ncbi:MAG: efflux RND transporter periplasmic adaptor subunit [Planctomycetota bacterium]
METAPHINTDSPATVMRDRPWLGRSTMRGIVIGTVIVVVVLGSAAAISSTGLLEWFRGGGDQDLAVYLVEPTDLTITLTEDGELKPRNSVEIKCELEGQSMILSVVEESTKIKKGDLLVELASDELQERLDSEEIQLRQIESAFKAAEQALTLQLSENASQKKKAEITLELAELELRRYLEGDFQGSLKSAEINIKQTEMDIKRREDELEKNRELAERGFVNKTKLEQLEFEYEKAQMTLEQNKLQLRILLEYEKPKNEKQKILDVDQAGEELERERQRAITREEQSQAKVDEQRDVLAMRTKRVEKLRAQIDRCRIIAPADGIVQYPGDENMWRHSDGNRIAPGERVYEGQTLIVLPDTSQMMVTTRIHEADRHQVEVDMPCLVKVPAVPGRTFNGKIARIARFADTANRWLNPELKEHTTEILLDETDAPVSPGDSAEIKILIDEARQVLSVPVQTVYSRGAHSYVFVQRGGDVAYTKVKIGRSSESMTEIVEGLDVGDRVLMHADRQLVATLPVPTTATKETPPPPMPPTGTPSVHVTGDQSDSRPPGDQSPQKPASDHRPSKGSNG